MTSRRNTFQRRTRNLGFTLFYMAGMAAIVYLLGEDKVPFGQYISLASVAVLGWLAIGRGSRWVYGIGAQYSDEDTAAALKTVFRIVGGGVLIAVAVSLLTTSPVPALTVGSFAGLVAGMATQTILGNAVAGLLLAIVRPVHLGDRVTVGRNSGTVAAITLMHIVLDTEDRQVMIPSSRVANSVLVRLKDDSKNDDVEGQSDGI